MQRSAPVCKMQENSSLDNYVENKAIRAKRQRFLKLTAPWRAIVDDHGTEIYRYQDLRAYVVA